MKGVKDGEQRSIKKAKKRGEGGEGPRTCDRGEEGQYGTLGKKGAQRAGVTNSRSLHSPVKTWLEIQVCSMNDRKWVHHFFF